jgi:hypothetical protein
MASKSVANQTKRSPRKTAAAASRTTVTAKKSASAAAATAPFDVQAENARSLISAGLKALGDVRGDIVARQSRIFELLLGIGQSPAWLEQAKSAAADPYGKFEEVFDQRVARSLERLGMPSPQALRELVEQMKALTELLQAAQPEPRRRR